MLKIIGSEKDDILKIAYQQMLQGCLDHPKQWVWYAVWIIKCKDGSHVGDVSFKGVNGDGSVEIGYGIKKTNQGQGYATEAVSAAVAWALQQPGITCVEAETEPNIVHLSAYSKNVDLFHLGLAVKKDRVSSGRGSEFGNVNGLKLDEASKLPT